MVNPYSKPVPPDMAAFLERYGVRQTGRDVPSGFRRFRVRNREKASGFERASAVALRDGLPGGHTFGVRYTEGTLTADFGAFGIATQPSAWLTTPDGGVVDLAWEGSDARYLGVAIPTGLLARAATGWRFWDEPVLPVLIARGWRPDMPEAEAIKLFP